MVEVIIKANDGEKATVHKGDFVFCVIGRKDGIDMAQFEGEYNAFHVIKSLGTGVKQMLQNIANDKESDDEDVIKTYLALEHGFLSAFFNSSLWIDIEEKKE